MKRNKAKCVKSPMLNTDTGMMDIRVIKDLPGQVFMPGCEPEQEPEQAELFTDSTSRDLDPVQSELFTDHKPGG